VYIGSVNNTESRRRALQFREGVITGIDVDFTVYTNNIENATSVVKTLTASETSLGPKYNANVTSKYVSAPSVLPTPTPVPPESSGGSSDTGKIVGAVVGTVGGVAIIGAAIFFVRRRKTSQDPTAKTKLLWKEEK